MMIAAPFADAVLKNVLNCVEDLQNQDTTSLLDTVADHCSLMSAAYEEFRDKLSSLHLNSTLEMALALRRASQGIFKAPLRV